MFVDLWSNIVYSISSCLSNSPAELSYANVAQCPSLVSIFMFYLSLYLVALVIAYAWNDLQCVLAIGDLYTRQTRFYYADSTLFFIWFCLFSIALNPFKKNIMFLFVLSYNRINLSVVEYRREVLLLFSVICFLVF